MSQKVTFKAIIKHGLSLEILLIVSKSIELGVLAQTFPAPLLMNDSNSADNRDNP
jgi:hypothetical protein